MKKIEVRIERYGEFGDGSLRLSVSARRTFPHGEVLALVRLSDLEALEAKLASFVPLNVTLGPTAAVFGSSTTFSSRVTHRSDPELRPATPEDWERYRNGELDSSCETPDDEPGGVAV